MTDETPAQTPVPVASPVGNADGLSTVPGSDDTGEPQSRAESPDPSKGLTEARDRYRTERDTAREELATAGARIERLQRADIERLAADGLSHAEDLFTLSGNSVADYLDDDGEVDSKKVSADIAAIVAERPGLRKQPTPGYDPSHGHGGPAKGKAATFADIFQAR